jgi:glycosyltransferase involved in cell wall biosynthesis
MGHGIDIDLFSPAPSGSRDPQELLELSKRAAPFIVLVIGRISPIKELELVIDQTRRAFCIEIHFVGAPQGAQDLSYQESLHALACSCGIDARVTFCGSVPRTLLPAKIRAAGCVVNVSSNTSLDKSLLEGMACAVPVLGAKQYASVLGVSGLGELVVESSPDSIAQGIVQLAKLDPQERQLVGMKLRDIVVREHALGPLVARIVNSFGTCRTSQN